MRVDVAKQQAAAPRSPVPRSWLLWAGAVVIVAQLVAMGLVVSRHAEQAAARHAAMLKAPAPVVATSGQMLAQQ